VSPSSASRERGNALQGAPPCAPTPLSHPVGEGLGVRAKKHKHLVCVYGAVVYLYETAGYIYGAVGYIYEIVGYIYGAVVYLYETAVYIYGAVGYIYETVGYIYGAVGYLYKTAGYVYGAIVEFLGAGRSIHGVCAG
jgi:hypothetical protein